MSKLREQMLEELQLRGATVKTQRIYLREVGNYAKYFGKSPEELGENELREYLLYLMKERNLLDGTYRFYVPALKFLYRTTLISFYSLQFSIICLPCSLFMQVQKALSTVVLFYLFLCL